MDSVQEETFTVSATGIIVDNKHHHPLLLRRRRHRLTEEVLRQALASGEKVLLEGKAKKRAKVTSKEIARIRRVIIGILPYVEITNLNRDANRATNVDSDMLRLTGKKSKKSGAKGQLPYSRSLTKQLGCVSQDTEPPKKSIHRSCVVSYLPFRAWCPHCVKGLVGYDGRLFCEH